MQKTASFHALNMVFPPCKYAIPTVGIGRSHRGNGQFPPWERPLRAVQENFLRRAHIVLAPCTHGTSPMLIYYLLRVDILSPPCKHHISSVQIFPLIIHPRLVYSG